MRGLSKFLANDVLTALMAVVTLGSGASLGPEGPSVNLGKAIGGRFRMENIGIAAGFAAGLNSPIAGRE